MTLVNLLSTVTVVWILKLSGICNGICIPPVAPAHGAVSLGRGGVVASFSCKPEYLLQGTRVVVCLNRKWSSTTPKCVAQQDLESSESKRGRKRKPSKSRRPGKRKISATINDTELQQHDQNAATSLNDLHRFSGSGKFLHKTHHKSNGVKDIIEKSEGVKQKEVKGIQIAKGDGAPKRKGRKRGNKRLRNKRKGRKGRKQKTRDKGVIQDNLINKMNINVEDLKETQNKEGINGTTILSTTKSRRKNRKGRHKGTKEERRKERRERRRLKKKQSDEENNRKQPNEDSTVNSSSSLFYDEQNQLNNDIIPNQNIKSFDTNLNSEVMSTTNYLVEPITKASTTVDKEVSEISFVPSGYHKDSTYPPIETQYIIEGSEDDETIVDIVQDISLISDNKEKNILFNPNLGRDDNSPIQINNIDENKNINPIKVKKEIQSKDIEKANIVRSLLQKEHFDNDIENDYVEYDEESVDDINLEDLPEGYPLDRLKQMGILPEGYIEKAIQDADDNGSSRFIETEEIDFGKLDMSCEISKSDSMYIPPPRAKNAHVSSYYTITNPVTPNNVYVEAVYECNFGYQLDSYSTNRLFCQKRQWLGVLPSCIPYRGEASECGKDNGDCQQICKIGKDGPSCHCYKGFSLRDDGLTCEDKNECSVNNGGCESGCFNKIGGFHCYCPQGYRITTNSKTCLDINECSLRNGHGPCQDNCQNTDGGYVCACYNLPGTHLAADNHTCEDVNECANDNGGCSHICLNTFGQTFCTCPDGFMLDMDWKTCNDIDECQYADIASQCDHGCVNIPGAWKCAEEKTQVIHCNDGFIPSNDNLSCEDIDECLDSNFGCQNFCVNTNGSAQCSCKTGFKLRKDKKSCRDFDECSSDNGKCQQLCINTIGSSYCKCEDGYFLDEDSKTCTDLDECQEENAGCQQICKNTNGSFSCSCEEGYELSDDFNCEDINECTLQIAKCQHDCLNDIGSYECICYDGYELGPDNKTCVDIDECGVDNGCSHFCTNHNGSYVCHCPPGHLLSFDEHSCKDVDECENENGGCSHICLNTEGGYNCQCPEGLNMIEEGSLHEHKHVCVDIDECLINNGNCSHECQNAEGTYSCNCPIGFEFMDDLKDSNTECQDVDECQINNAGCSHNCINTEGSYNCQCLQGYIITGDSSSLLHICEDIDECQKDNGGCSHFCHNLDGTHECLCPSGLAIDVSYDYYDDFNENLTSNNDNDVVMKICMDVDECSNNNGGCSHKCHNVKGEYKCSCPIGYILNKDDKTCQDIDECIVENGGCSQECKNTEGSYNCLCRNGFVLINEVNCQDINECETGEHFCSHDCMNEIGRYFCSCPSGLILDGSNATCSDINECGTNNGGCSHECTNNHGNYSCFCPRGLILNQNNHTCDDVNECDVKNPVCSHNCINTEGSFECSCPAGLTLSIDQHTCIDVDECGDNKGGCSYQCANHKGNYTCLCPPGTELSSDKHTCADVNECADDNGGCSNGCLNMEGGYDCSCPDGLELGLDNHTCHDFDECLSANGGCSDTCINTRGAFRCECPSGYLLAANGLKCKDIDECSASNGGCSHICVNKKGSFKCKCPSGYQLSQDSYNCLDIDECIKSPCQHQCFNTPGSHYCDCDKGFKPRPDALHRCLDVNECDEGNAGCAQDCYNTIGSYHCGCTKGYYLNTDKHSCDYAAVNCKMIVAPLHGDMVCTDDLNGGAYPEDTVCSFTCNKGATLHGAANITCTEDATWSYSPATCKAKQCPQLSGVEHGRVSPTRCTRRTSSAGQHCYLSCVPGYRVVGNPVRTCNYQGMWEPQPATPYCEKESLKPFIQCPRDVTVKLAPHQKSSYIRLPQPKANVDWFRLVSGKPVSTASKRKMINGRFVDSSPEWAKQLETDLPSGKTTITFVARSPVSDEQAQCSFIVEVEDKEAPQVYGCPKSFTLHLPEGQTLSEVTWTEPEFKDNVEVSHLWKSMEPGRHLKAGTYPVHYVAMDPYRNRAKCSFTVTVVAHNSQYAHPGYGSSQVWVVCPGLNNGKPILMFAWRVPLGCTVVSSTSNVQPALWEHTLTNSEANNARDVVGVAQPQDRDQRGRTTVLNQQYSIPQQSDHSHHSAPDRGDIASDHQDERSSSASTAMSQLLSNFPTSYSNRNYAIAHARVQGGGKQGHRAQATALAQGNGNMQALSLARVYNYG